MNKNKKHTKQQSELYRQRLYSAFLFINNLYSLEDLLYLKKKEFLKICEIQDLNWRFHDSWLKKGFLIKEEKNLWAYQHTNSINFKTKNYGDIVFYSSQKISKNKKLFLKKISGFLAGFLYSIENKEKISNIKKQWVDTFDSFCQAFCITDKDFNLIRSNQAFQQLLQKDKKELLYKNLFKMFPFHVKQTEKVEKEGSFLVQGEKNNESIYWEISFKTLYLRKENSKVFLFLIKNVSTEMSIESKLSNQVKEKEIGLIKGSLAHELNNPIAGIKALLSVIDREVSPNEKLIKESLEEMQTAMNTCHKVVQNLLFVSKPEPNRILGWS